MNFGLPNDISNGNNTVIDISNNNIKELNGALFMHLGVNCCMKIE